MAGLAVDARINLALQPPDQSPAPEVLGATRPTTPEVNKWLLAVHEAARKVVVAHEIKDWGLVAARGGAHAFDEEANSTLSRGLKTLNEAINMLAARRPTRPDQCRKCLSQTARPIHSGVQSRLVGFSSAASVYAGTSGEWSVPMA